MNAVFRFLKRKLQSKPLINGLFFALTNAFVWACSVYFDTLNDYPAEQFAVGCITLTTAIYGNVRFIIFAAENYFHKK